MTADILLDDGWRERIEARLHTGPDMVVQPVFRLSDLEIVGYEALSRFSEFPVGPDVWFAKAKELNLLIELEISAVTAALEVLPKLPLHNSLSINASAVTLIEEPFVLLMLGRFDQRIIIELTEHDAVDNYEVLKTQLARIRLSRTNRRGVRLGIDDVGAGFASMRHILQLDPDVLKLDMSLVRNIDTNPKLAALVQSLTLFAAQTDIMITAEGIETAGELAKLQEIGVPQGQGYFLSKPIAVVALQPPTEG